MAVSVDRSVLIPKFCGTEFFMLCSGPSIIVGVKFRKQPAIIEIREVATSNFYKLLYKLQGCRNSHRTFYTLIDCNTLKVHDHEFGHEFHDLLYPIIRFIGSPFSWLCVGSPCSFRLSLIFRINFDFFG